MGGKGKIQGFFASLRMTGWGEAMTADWTRDDGLGRGEDGGWACDGDGFRRGEDGGWARDGDGLRRGEDGGWARDGDGLGIRG
jgi:hypothetical protein